MSPQLLESDSSSDDRRRRRGCYMDKMFPVRNKALVHASKAVSNTCIATVTAVNVFAASVPHLYENEFKHLTPSTKAMLLSLPFIFIPCGAAAVCFTHAAEHQRNLLSTAKIMVACEFIYSLGLLGSVIVIFEILPENVAWFCLVVILMTIQKFICKNVQIMKLLYTLGLLALVPLIVNNVPEKVAWDTILILAVTIWGFTCEDTQHTKLLHELASIRLRLLAARAQISDPSAANTDPLLQLQKVEAAASASAEKGALATAKAAATTVKAEAETAATKANQKQE